MRYGVFSGDSDNSADMRNTNDDMELRRIRRSDYSADMHKLQFCNDLHRVQFLRPRPGACARLTAGPGIRLRRSWVRSLHL